MLLLEQSGRSEIVVQIKYAKLLEKGVTVYKTQILSQTG